MVCILYYDDTHMIISFISVQEQHVRLSNRLIISSFTIMFGEKGK